MKKYKEKILFYDIETAPLKFWGWGCGKQVVRHGQLVKGHSRYGIICITYCFNDGKPAKCINWDYEKQDTKSVVEQFDAVIEEYKPDIIIGKNSDRFDNKHLNTIRMWNKLPSKNGWFQYCDDLEKQMRKYFYLPSHALDYISNELGLGGKIKMEFQDWINIVEKDPVNGLKSFKKMCNYGKKDIVDTRTIWDYCVEYFDRKGTSNHIGVMAGHDRTSCNKCGSTDTAIKQYRTTKSGMDRVQLQCSSCSNCFTIAKSVYDKERS